MEPEVPKLPRYVFKRANGSYRYKRNVPKTLVRHLGKKTLYRQLGDTLTEAMKQYPYVHAKFEAMFDQERQKSTRERALELIRGNLGDGVADLVLAGAVHEHGKEDYALMDLAEDLEGKVPHEVLAQVYSGKLKEDPVTLTTVLDDYLAYKTEDGVVDRLLENRVEQVRREMTALYGKTKMKVVPIQDITRRDANDLRDVLLARISPNSVARTLGTVRAAMNHTITERGLNMVNVFEKLKIKGAGSTKNDRLPITDEQMEELWSAFEDDQTASALFTLLADTGARLAEITGLEAQDVDLEEGVLHIRPNGIRTLKTRSSERRIPLSQRAILSITDRHLVASATSPIFPRYARPRGADAASAMLMKRLRTKISDPKIAIHSLRHRMKDKLRNTGCPEAVSTAILGHSANTVAANYGVGYSIELMRAAMAKVWVFPRGDEFAGRKSVISKSPGGE